MLNHRTKFTVLQAGWFGKKGKEERAKKRARKSLRRRAFPFRRRIDRRRTNYPKTTPNVSRVEATTYREQFSHNDSVTNPGWVRRGVHNELSSDDINGIINDTNEPKAITIGRSRHLPIAPPYISLLYPAPFAPTSQASSQESYGGLSNGTAK